MERQLRIQHADLLAVAERRDRDRAIHIAELRNFEKRKRRDKFSSGKLEGVSNERIVLVATNLDFVSVAFAVVSELGFYAGFSDQSI